MTREEVIAYLRDQAALPFEWGRTDCVQLAAGVVERVRGSRPALPAYDSEVSAKRALAALGGLETAVTAILGPIRRHRPDCLDGDIVLTAFAGEQGLGIATPRCFWVRRTGGGLVPVDLTLAIGFWRA